VLTFKKVLKIAKHKKLEEAFTIWMGQLNAKMVWQQFKLLVKRQKK
jgi:hypothetical protein